VVFNYASRVAAIDGPFLCNVYMWTLDLILIVMVPAFIDCVMQYMSKETAYKRIFWRMIKMDTYHHEDNGLLTFACAFLFFIFICMVAVYMSSMDREPDRSSSKRVIVMHIPDNNGTWQQHA